MLVSAVWSSTAWFAVVSKLDEGKVGAFWIQPQVGTCAWLRAWPNRARRGWVLRRFSGANAAVMLALALVALGSGPTATAHMTSSQTNIALSRSPQNLPAFLNVSEAPAVRRMALLTVATCRRAWATAGDQGSCCLDTSLRGLCLASPHSFSRHYFTFHDLQ